MDTPHQHQGSGIRHFVDVVRRRKWVLILLLVLVPLAAVLVSMRQEKLYQATSQVLLGRQDLAATLAGVVSPFYGSDRTLQAEAEIARNPDLATATLRAAGVKDRSAGQFLALSSVVPKPNVDVLQFSVTDKDSGLAVVLANEYARQYLRRNLALETEALRRAVNELNRQVKAGDPESPSYQPLVDRLEQLKTTEKLRDVNLSLLQPATGAIQVQPRPKRNAILGAILGLILGLGIIFLLEAVDTRVRHADEVTRRLGIPLLARIPKRRRHSSARPVMLEDSGGPYAEPYRMLRSNLEFATLDHPLRVLMITSAVGQEGKTTTATNLAVSLARAGRRVALVDLDLRRPAVAEAFGLDRNRGLTDVALGRATLQEVLVPVVSPSGESVPAEGNGAPQPSGNGHPLTGGWLWVLPSGPLPPDPGEFVGSRAVAGIISRLRESCDLVILDTPPLLNVGDAMTLSAGVDAVLAVVRPDALRGPTLGELRRVLDVCPAPKLGYVLTGVDAAEEYYGYSGYYEPLPRSRTEEEEQRTSA